MTSILLLSLFLNVNALKNKMFGTNMVLNKQHKVRFSDLNRTVCQNKSSAHYTREHHSFLSNGTMVLTIGVTSCSDRKKDAQGVKCYVVLCYNYRDDLVGS